MDNVLFDIYKMNITPWQLVGFLGAMLFFARWIAQALYSYKYNKSLFPVSFWYLSISGNLLMLVYFIFGRADIVGLISNLFPLIIALFNLLLIHTKSKEA